jgi:NAD(P)-dependent dehydrogenase (short-subunit alcohol dehydrogenase family)
MSKTILITGCSSGIGLSAAQILHQKGYRVFATARNPSDVKALQAQGIESLALDVNDSASIQQAVAEVLDKTGGTLDALFNNAGFAQPGAVEDLTRDMMRHQFETNVFGTMELTNQVIPVMRKQGHGRIIQNTSILGIITMPYRGAYNASKFALEGFSNTLRQELRHTPIRVSIIAPGPIISKFRDNAYRHYQKTILQQDSVHSSFYQKMEKFFFTTPETERKVTLPPEAVVKKLLHAIESNHPKAHYYVGLPAHLFATLRRILPDKTLDWVIEKILREESK